MTFKAVLASMLLVQSALGQCLGRAAAPCGLVGGYGAGLTGGYGSGLGGGYGSGLGGGYGSGYGCGAAGVASTGGGLPVSSTSPIAPVGVSVISENVYEGQLCAGGNLPFLGSVGIEGVVSNAGTGAVSYGCGDGACFIGSEAPIATGILAPEYFAPSAVLVNQGIAGYGGNAGYGLGGAAGYGLGCSNGYGLGGAARYGLGSASCGCGY